MYEKILKRHDIEDIINVLYLNFLIETNNIYFLNEKETLKLADSVLKFFVNEIAFLYKKYFLDMEIRDVLYTYPKDPVLKKLKKRINNFYINGFLNPKTYLKRKLIV